MNKLNREIIGRNSKERENKKDDGRKKAFLSELQYGSEARFTENEQEKVERKINRRRKSKTSRFYHT